MSPNPNTTVTRRIWPIVVSLALLSFGVILRDQLPTPEDLAYETFNYDESAPLLGEISNVRVTTGETLGGVSTYASWVVIDYHFIPDSLGSPDARLVTTDGTIYDELPVTACPSVYPGLKVECTLAFEMPLEKLPGAEVYFSPEDTSMAPRIVVPLQNPVATHDIVRERFEL
ncbi:hypothetical protein CGLAUT_01800 [Corynebacterium glaucum]|uniref:hypothetical protein n=1 Tax=Corynebacterium glaucum TaxID=187491 RepID=UPI0025B3C296|nr:hypothetical protein [Corynebacterium glaucum]WJZ06866.1 hypothetical protein CGLAUT_01800 [Corynebacterium glaucum]